MFVCQTPIVLGVFFLFFLKTTKSRSQGNRSHLRAHVWEITCLLELDRPVCVYVQRHFQQSSFQTRIKARPEKTSSSSSRFIQHSAKRASLAQVLRLPRMGNKHCYLFTCSVLPEDELPAVEVVTSLGSTGPLRKLESRLASREKLRQTHGLLDACQTWACNPRCTQEIRYCKTVQSFVFSPQNKPFLNPPHLLPQAPLPSGIKLHITSFIDGLDFFINTWQYQLTPFFKDETIDNFTLSSPFLALNLPPILENYYKI